MATMKMIAAALATSMTLSACVEGAGGLAPSNENAQFLSSEERQIRAVEQQRVSTATNVGCLTGGLVRAVIVAGNDNLSRLEQTLIAGLGTAIGCGLGRASGNYVNSRTREYASANQQYSTMIAAADQDIARYRSLNTTSRRLIRQQRNKVARLNAQYRAGQLSKADYRAQIASARTNVRSLRNQEGALDRQLAVMRKDSEDIRRGRGNSADLDRRIRSLEREKARLATNAANLAEAYSDVPSDVARLDF